MLKNIASIDYFLLFKIIKLISIVASTAIVKANTICTIFNKFSAGIIITWK